MADSPCGTSDGRRDLLRASLLAAVGEEMLFRGVLYTWLRSQSRPQPQFQSAPRHMRRFMAFPPFFRSRSSWGWASGGCANAPVRSCQRSLFTHPQCRAYRVGILRNRMDGAAAGMGRLITAVVNNEASASCCGDAREAEAHRSDIVSVAPRLLHRTGDRAVGIACTLQLYETRPLVSSASPCLGCSRIR